MSHLKKLLIEILDEASFEADEKSRQDTKEFVSKLKNKISAEDGKVVYKHKRPDHFITDIDGIKVKLYDKDSTYPEASSAYARQDQGEYIHDNKELRIYNCDIKKDPKLEIKFSEPTVNHEFTHSKDFARILKGRKGSDKDKAKLIQTGDPSKGRTAYVSSPVEFNSHFFHLTIPTIEKYLDHKQVLPSYKDFQNDLLANREVKNFYHDLTPEYKKKLLKRLYTFYSGMLDVQNGKSPQPVTKIEELPGGEKNEKVYKKSLFIDKLKGLFKKD